MDVSGIGYIYISPNNNSNREYCDSPLDFGVPHVQTIPHIGDGHHFHVEWAAKDFQCHGKMIAANSHRKKSGPPRWIDPVRNEGFSLQLWSHGLHGNVTETPAFIGKIGIFLFLNMFEGYTAKILVYSYTMEGTNPIPGWHNHGFL